MGYAPAGMTEAEYKATKANEAQAKATKKGFWAKKDPKVETLTEWMVERDEKIPGFNGGKGLRFVKLKGKALEPSGDGRNFFGEKVAGAGKNTP
tara:strand:- start:84 stop:365 length:282 start_codon:yes stop_codon:yes gene_type:complete